MFLPNEGGRGDMPSKTPDRFLGIQSHFMPPPPPPPDGISGSATELPDIMYGLFVKMLIKSDWDSINDLKLIKYVFFSRK